MKRLLLQISLVAVLVLPCRAEMTWEEIEQEIRKLVPEPEWTVVKDHESLTLVRKGCRMLNGVNLPIFMAQDPDFERKYWEKWGHDADFKITIRVGPSLSDGEYGKILAFRASLAEQRIKTAAAEAKKAGVMFGEQDRYEERSAVEKLIPLPRFRFESKAVYFASTGENWMRVRPETALQVRSKVLELLGKTCAAYPKEEK